MDFRDKKDVLRVLIACDALLIILYLLTNVIDLPSWTIKHWLDLNAETNIPTWFSSVQLLGIAALSFALIMVPTPAEKNKFLTRSYFLLGLVFLFFSMDETATIHEGLTKIFQSGGINSPLPGAHGLWLFIYPAVFLAVIAIFWKSIRAFLYDKPGRNIFILGAFIFVAGGAVLETLGYYVAAEKLIDPSCYFIQIALEEGMELVGQTLMIYGLLIKLEATRTR